ncbi:MAG: ATP-binding protein [Anaerolineae bacterium]|nr:ATP-binding protein [Anaerolineae bacterium]
MAAVSDLKQGSPVAEHVTLKARITIADESDIIVASQKGRLLAREFGFSTIGQFITATVISEVAHNIVTYATHGEILLHIIEDDSRRGLLLIASDEGPGIANVELALRDGYSTGSGLGLGLSGARRLMDEFEIVSEPGKGTTITMKKWQV